MSAKSFYALIAFGALLWLHYWAADPKEMVTCALIAAGSFTMYAVQIIEDRCQALDERISRLWELQDPMRDIDDA